MNVDINLYLLLLKNIMKGIQIEDLGPLMNARAIHFKQYYVPFTVTEMV